MHVLNDYEVPKIAVFVCAFLPWTDLSRTCLKLKLNVYVEDTYHSLLETWWNPGKLLGIFGLLTFVFVRFFNFAEVVTDVSNRGVFREQTVHYKFMGFLFNTLDIMFLRFTLACFADFSVS